MCQPIHHPLCPQLPAQRLPQRTVHAVGTTYSPRFTTPATQRTTEIHDTDSQHTFASTQTAAPTPNLIPHPPHPSIQFLPLQFVSTNTHALPFRHHTPTSATRLSCQAGAAAHQRLSTADKPLVGQQLPLHAQLLALHRTGTGAARFATWRSTGYVADCPLHTLAQWRLRPRSSRWLRLLAPYQPTG